MVGYYGPDRPVYMVGDPRTPLSLVLGAKEAARGESTDSNVPVETRLESGRGNDREHTYWYTYMHVRATERSRTRAQISTGSKFSSTLLRIGAPLILYTKISSLF